MAGLGYFAVVGVGIVSELAEKDSIFSYGYDKYVGLDIGGVYLLYEFTPKFRC